MNQSPSYFSIYPFLTQEFIQEIRYKLELLCDSDEEYLNLPTEEQILKELLFQLQLNEVSDREFIGIALDESRCVYYLINELFRKTAQI